MVALYRRVNLWTYCREKIWLTRLLVPELVTTWSRPVPPPPLPELEDEEPEDPFVIVEKFSWILIGFEVVWFISSSIFVYKREVEEKERRGSAA